MTTVNPSKAFIKLPSNRQEAAITALTYVAADVGPHDDVYRRWNRRWNRR